MTFAPLSSAETRRFRVGVIFLGFFLPVSIASAGVLSFLGDFLSKGVGTFHKVKTSQNVPLLSATGGPDASYEYEREVDIVDEEAMVADVGPSGTILDIQEEASRGMISTYTVREGDSFSQIAQMFGISANTILWANNLSRGSSLKVGQELIILPVSGVLHTVKKGDTVGSIAKKYSALTEDIFDFNALPENAELALGEVVIVPDGKIPEPKVQPRATARLRGASGPTYDGYYLRPVYGARKTQGLHGYNGIDFGASIGTPVLASAAGQIIVARPFGYNGGYGKYVVISHDNGTQTLYGHLNTVYATAGEYVVAGQAIGEVGNTGRSTGPHLHFEVRGAKNPF